MAKPPLLPFRDEGRLAFGTRVRGRPGGDQVPRPVFSCSSSIFFDASALVSSSSTSSPASSARVWRYERWAPVIGSSPVTQLSGSLMVLLSSARSAVRLSVIRVLLYG